MFLASATSTLDGTLNVSLLGGFTPASGNVFEIIHANLGIFGGFDNFSLPALPGGLGWAIVYTGLGTFLSVQGAVLPGDFNRDGKMDAADYVFWRNAAGPPSDYNTWRANFGRQSSSGSITSAIATVPEPATLVMLIVAGVGMCLRRRYDG